MEESHAPRHQVLELKASVETKLTAILSLWTTLVRYVDSSAPGISPGYFNNLIKLLNRVT